ncbi:MAG: DUF3293 domain-containing protein [Verrucomicrobia bacterium]|nr:DUF3293 domain-containing protein [Verrucomicrobiota bacterium]
MRTGILNPAIPFEPSFESCIQTHPKRTPPTTTVHGAGIRPRAIDPPGASSRYHHVANARLDAWKARAHSAAVKDAYHQTVFLVLDDGKSWPREFAVLTACNPDGTLIGDDENARRTEALRRQLEARGLVLGRVDGCSPDLVHREPGFAARLTVEDAVVLGRWFQQEAVFFVRGDEVLLVPCDGAVPVSLGSWQKRAITTRGIAR